MDDKLYAKLPHTTKYFIAKQNELKKKFQNQKSSAFIQEWNKLMQQKENVVKAVAMFIKLVGNKLLLDTFLQKEVVDGVHQFKFSPMLEKLVKDNDLAKAIFEDVSEQTLRIIKKYKANEAIDCLWNLTTEGRKVLFEFKINKIKDSLILQTGIKNYIEKREELKNKTVQKEPELSPEERAKKYVNELFESFRIFNRDILGIKSKRQKKAFAIELFKEVLEYSDDRNKINFKYMQTYDDFDISVVNNAVKEVLKHRVEEYISNNDDIPNDIVDDIVHSRKSDYFLLSLSKNFIEKFFKELKNLIADTFFETAALGKSAATIPPIIQEAINGTLKYRNILVSGRNNWIASKDAQVWNRVTIAKKKQEAEIKELEETVAYYKKKINGIKKNIKAIRQAQKIDMNYISKYTASLLCDIALNEDKSHTEEKRLLQFVPKGPVALRLAEIVERGKRGARTPGQKDDFARALRFYEGLNSNNDINSLKLRLKTYNEELPEYEERYENASERLEEMKRRGLEFYDDALNIMKQTIIENLGKPKLAR
jgi:hypothetical protein